MSHKEAIYQCLFSHEEFNEGMKIWEEWLKLTNLHTTSTAPLELKHKRVAAYAAAMIMADLYGDVFDQVCDALFTVQFNRLLKLTTEKSREVREAMKNEPTTVQ